MLNTKKILCFKFCSFMKRQGNTKIIENPQKCLLFILFSRHLLLPTFGSIRATCEYEFNNAEIRKRYAQLIQILACGQQTKT